MQGSGFQQSSFPVSQYAKCVMRILTLFIFLFVVPSIGWSQTGTPETPQESLARGHELLQQGKVTEAMAILQQLAAVRPPVKGLQHELGVAYYRTGKLVEAQQAFAAAI